MSTFKRIVSWTMLVVGLVGFAVTFPLWLLDKISDRSMLGVTLALSWLALWYEAVNSIFITHDEDD